MLIISNIRILYDLKTILRFELPKQINVGKLNCQKNYRYVAVKVQKKKCKNFKHPEDQILIFFSGMLGKSKYQTFSRVKSP